jgi:nitrile hydratase alpha subunit/nitrile hydratase beta subunit-like protein
MGDRVRARAVDPAHHTRVPRYARGQVGEVVEVQGAWPLADDRARGFAEPLVVREPRAVLAEFGLALPADTGIVMHDTSAESRHMVLPRRPAGTAGLTEAEPAALVTREGLIGTAAV